MTSSRDLDSNVGPFSTRRVVLAFLFRIYVALILFQSYRDFEVVDTQSLKPKW